MTWMMMMMILVMTDSSYNNQNCKIKLQNTNQGGDVVITLEVGRKGSKSNIEPIVVIDDCNSIRKTSEFFFMLFYCIIHRNDTTIIKAITITTTLIRSVVLALVIIICKVHTTPYYKERGCFNCPDNDFGDIK
jgi:hypothetical protein